MPPHALTPTPKTYAQLRHAVVAVVVRGRQAIDRAWLETYHETGRLIHEHVLLHRDRADYGARTFEKLVADTKINLTTLKECVRFYRCYPIRRGRVELVWTHYRLLIQVADPIQRQSLEAAAIKHAWTSTELETRVRSHNATALAANTAAPKPAPPVERLTPRRGVPGLLRVVTRGDNLALDLGFKNYAALPAASAKLKPGAIVRWDADGVRPIPDATPAQLFTYCAAIRKIVDGDTLDITLTLAPGFTRDLKLRLRGLDCPEMDTAAGRAAKAFVENLLSPGDEVIVCTTKPDKYDRYLADVFIGESRDQSPEARARSAAPRLSPNASRLEDEVFLNNALLTAGHAVPYDGGTKEE